MNDSGRARRWLRWAVPVATLVLLALFARKVDWAHAWSAIAHADPALLGIATIANLGTAVIKGVRWALFLRAVGIHGTGEALRVTFAGHALNNVLVANGGDAVRVAAMARRHRISSAPVLATVAIDKLCDLVTYAALFVIAALTLPLPPELARWRTPGILVLTAIGVLVGALVLRSPGKSPREAGGHGEHPTLVSRARLYWHRLARTSAELATGRRLAAALALALLSWAGQWATFHYTAHAAALPMTAADSLLALLVVNASFLVRLTPGNVGVFQLLYALAATSTGLDQDSAVAVAFLISIIQYIPITLIGLWYARSLATEEHAPSVAQLAELGPEEGNQKT